MAYSTAAPVERLGGGIRHRFSYKTTDSIETVTASGYFNLASALFDQFDTIEVISSTGGTPRFENIYISSASRAATVTTARSGASVFTWAGKPAASAMSAIEIFVSDSGDDGSKWRSNGANWSPVSPINFQSGIPFVLVSSGTMGDNGALSGLTATQRAYAAAYVYLPANAISTGSAAGWYYAVFSSTTAATVYNNTYTGGVATVPTSPTAFATTGPGAYTQVTTEVVAQTRTLPGGMWGANGSLEVIPEWTNNNSAGVKTAKVKFGSTTILSLALSTTVNTRQFTRHSASSGSQAVQYGYLAGTSSPFASSASAPTLTVVNAANDVTLSTTMTLATATDTITSEGFIFKIFPRS